MRFSVLFILLGFVISAFSQTDTFTYQGKLNDGGATYSPLGNGALGLTASNNEKKWPIVANCSTGRHLYPGRIRSAHRTGYSH